MRAVIDCFGTGFLCLSLSATCGCGVLGTLYALNVVLGG